MEEREATIYDNLPEFNPDIQAEAKNGEAIFPDGFAVLGRAETFSNLKPSHLSPSEYVIVKEHEKLAEVIMSRLADREEEPTNAITEKVQNYLTNG